MIDSFQAIIAALPLLFKGLLVTLKICCFGVFIGLPFGCIMGIINCHNIRVPLLRQIISTYISIIRGSPLFVQLLIIYFALPDIIGIQLTPFEAGVIALGLNSAAYIAEIIRGGINSIPQGQWDGCHALGYSKIQTMQYVVLPQGLRNVVPSITNELAALVKESCILMILGVPELTKVSKEIVSREFKPLEIYITAAFLYFLTTSAISFVAKKWEKKPHEHH